MIKTTTIFVLIGALLGIVAASYIVPPALSWYTEPGGLPHGADVQALVQVPAVIKYATQKLMFGQLVGATVGAIVGLVLGILFVRRGRSPQAKPA
ncbi:MAG TPA: hypothetical protein VJN96_10895 [Vicinamibacterales bacterium]|nr:hypothetical protein [Vicinamibacterales bacterium]